MAYTTLSGHKIKHRADGLCLSATEVETINTALTDLDGVSAGTPSAGSVTNSMLATDVKVGSLATLTTTEVASVVGAINELDAENGDLSGLSTAATDLAAAITEVDGHCDTNTTAIGTLASLTTTEKTNLVGAINEVNAENTGMVTLTGSQTLTNKTLTTPVISDGDAGLTITSANQTSASATITFPDCGDAADTVVLADTTQTLTNKTLTAPKIVTTGKICDAGGDEYVVFTEATTPVTYLNITSGDTTVAPSLTGDGENNTGLLLAGKGTGKVRIGDGADRTKLMTFELVGATSGRTATIASSHTADVTVTLPNATCTLVGADTTDTLTNKTLTSPTVNTPAISDGVLTDSVNTWTLSAHDYAGGHEDWTLSAAELLNPCHKPTNADDAINAIVATTIRPYLFINETGKVLTVKTAAGSGIAITNGKSAFVMSDGVNVIRLTPDA